MKPNSVWSRKFNVSLATVVRVTLFLYTSVLYGCTMDVDVNAIWDLLK